MSEHPIEALMLTAMDSIRDMIDVNTIIGDPIQTENGVVIIPISKVCFGFAAGGSEFKGETIDEYSKKEKEKEIQYRLPFGGGSGAGVKITPVAFLIVQDKTVRLLPVDYVSTVDKLIDYVPDLMEKVHSFVDQKIKQAGKKEPGDVAEPMDIFEEEDIKDEYEPEEPSVIEEEILEEVGVAEKTEEIPEKK